VVERWGLFVDAGWLFAAGATLAFGEPVQRSEIGWQPEVMIPDLIQESRRCIGASPELLRCYWYDGAPNRMPTPQQNEVARMEDVKLRLGRTARGGQKGVDGLLIHDLITLSFRQSITDAVLVTGDEDMLEAVESAQRSGTRVHPLEIPIGGIADPLLNAVDRRVLIDSAFMDGRLEWLDAPQRDPIDLTSHRQPPPPEQRPAWMDADSAVSASPGAVLIAEVQELAQDFALEWAHKNSPEDRAELLADRPNWRRTLIPSSSAAQPAG
jgi:uncharacterized LabA/DUF88 family protein